MLSVIYYITILSFGFAMSYIFLVKNVPILKYNILKSPSLFKKCFAIAIFIISSTIVSSLVYFSFEKLKYIQEVKQNIKKEKLIREADSLRKIAIENEKALVKIQRREKIPRIIQAYFNASASRDIIGYDTLFVYPVKKYFVMTNVDIETLDERIKFEWNHHKPFVFKTNDNNTHIEDYMDSIIVTINLNPENINENIIAKMKFNKNFKIYHLSNYIQTVRSDAPMSLTDSIK